MRSFRAWWRKRCRGEAGAALELALIFLTASAFAVTVLLNFASTSSSATVITRTVRGNDYDADAAMQAAIATLRVSTTQGFVGNCLPSGFVPAFTLNTPTRPLRVDCYPLSAPSAQRRVVLSVCPSSAASPCPDAVSLLRADIIFYDDSGTGRALTIVSWSNA